ncbi:putative signal transduction protein [Solidesulfovibrio fructosivorans JJ]]|uniref:Putative signal transduction protein n=1 Tax=Solidesulfovibrio fructosivorans JJ] TaxID=596151 RepID=E1JX44_SOLFR|nr:HDOD domain-containing protein [Solidesulfovibrio fructosivorans]EFL51009.1 putative signal transduction protein [Solidesulfovibrio fructosivorans JJ]]
MNQERAQRFLLELPAVRDDLPFSPALLTRLFRLTDENGASPLEAIADAIAEDQGLSARMLGLANSAFYGLQAEVGTVARAVAVLGLREVRGLILALGMRGLASARPLPPGFALSPYLEHQLSVAVAAMELARETGVMDPDDAFTAGVLHDLGKLITALYRPDDWLAEARLVAAGPLAWHEAEELHWGLDHGLIGAMVLASWNLPPRLTEPVNWHHAPDAAPEHSEPCRLLGLADACVHERTGHPLPDGDRIAPLAPGVGIKPDTAREATDSALAARQPGLLAAALA